MRKLRRRLGNHRYRHESGQLEDRRAQKIRAVKDPVGKRIAIASRGDSSEIGSMKRTSCGKNLAAALSSAIAMYNLT